MNKLSVLIGLFIVILIAGAALVLLPPSANAPTGITETEPTSFAECVADGNPVMESYPRQCNTPNGGHFIENIGNALEKQDLIVAATPRPGDSAVSPLTISGEARGYWFFEASFPYELQDAQGNMIAQGPVQATGDWMTEEFVPFTIDITFPPQPVGSEGTLLLKKDNPSGLPENEDALVIPVVF
ncbi:MAG: Gmad2 immunoglobulin-like domain-containing protein [Candidatus Pacebacteria bacterium]|nr:Gmad2 immunoglobulin-like domain-containing protein [Candidatus Paceibacterota bacterium]